MPKRRSNTIANTTEGLIGGSGSNLSEGIIEDLVNAVNGRLDNVVTVQGLSRTRNRIEDINIVSLGNNRYEVSSDEGGTYIVDMNENSCECGQYVYRNEFCRHLIAVREALGEVAEVDTINNVEATRRARDIRDEINRSIRGGEQDDNHFYTDNEVDFNNDFAEINDDSIEYEYENVLNGNNSTFGVELEFVGGDANAIARELYDLGIVSSPRRLGYHSRSEPGKWKLERDGSVSDGDSGGEIVSPVLKDTPETWEQIKVICDVAKRHGARIDENCGGHIHINMEKLDTARQRWRRFFKTIEVYEDCIYRAAGGDLGVVRAAALSYAKPFSGRATESKNIYFNMNTDDDVREMARVISRNNRYYGINLTNISRDRAPTVEFRHFNGSLNPKQIQANIKMAAGIINASEKARFRDTEDEIYKKRGNILKNSSTSDGVRTKKKMMEFLDIAFPRKNDKKAILNVFKKTTWSHFTQEDFL
ncbi:amidoligase family protein [Clostridium perfringens]|uniref:amidoligase family protein n=1 Tax=Clostridium perfringens TaxID=1502 RepID=UPI00224847F4|nr:amidoligase family protein [Clostridium perfringens]MCX0368663.1 amidoligase family protein [Clostridium perfringens]